MKVFISVDIEGCSGITHWNEADRTHPDYPAFCQIMTQETLAAIDGARAAGATQIVVKDAHSSGRNLDLSLLPEDVCVVRSWAGHPMCMVQELDETYDAVVMVGYHAAAGSEGNALAHTLSLDPAAVVLNGAPASEFRIHALAAATVGVPVVFVSGDKALMDEVQALNPRIGRCAVKEGRGQSTVTLTPAAACRAIRDGVQAALSGDLDACLLPLEERYVLDITYADPCKAERHRWYPGAEHVGARTVRLDCARFFDVLRALNYMT